MTEVIKECITSVELREDEVMQVLAKYIKDTYGAEFKHTDGKFYTKYETTKDSWKTKLIHRGVRFRKRSNHE